MAVYGDEVEYEGVEEQETPSIAQIISAAEPDVQQVAPAPAPVVVEQTLVFA